MTLPGTFPHPLGASPDDDVIPNVAPAPEHVVCPSPYTYADDGTCRLTDASGQINSSASLAPACNEGAWDPATRSCIGATKGSVMTPIPDDFGMSLGAIIVGVTVTALAAGAVVGAGVAALVSKKGEGPRYGIGAGVGALGGVVVTYAFPHVLKAVKGTP